MSKARALMLAVLLTACGGQSTTSGSGPAGCELVDEVSPCGLSMPLWQCGATSFLLEMPDGDIALERSPSWYLDAQAARAEACRP